MYADIIRARIRAIREAQGLRALDMAESIGVSRPFYTQLEGGQRRLTVDNLFKIIRALGVSISEICGEEILKDPEVARMRGYAIPINNFKVWTILNNLIQEEPEEIGDWIVVFNTAVKELQNEPSKKQKTAG